MRLSQSIDLGKSLRQVFGDDPESAERGQRLWHEPDPV